MDKDKQAQAVTRIITPGAEAMGFEIVRVLLVGSGSKPTLQIMAERNDGSGTITLDECGKLSQAISVLLDVEGVMGDAPYTLEVGSPGIDRPLTRLKDFSRYAGQDARIETAQLIDGRKRFRGILQGLRGERVALTTDEGEVEIPFAAIEKAKLSLDEERVNPRQKKKKF